MSLIDFISRRDMLKLTAAAVTTVALQKSATSFASTVQPKNPIPNRPEHAKNRFLKSMNCSQAILETYAEEMGMSVENARKVASAFAGGMGMGTECGAVTGAFMVIGKCSTRRKARGCQCYEIPVRICGAYIDC